MDTWRDINNTLSTVAEEVGRSLVQVTNGHRGAGAGIIWGSDGLIITNAHVVRRQSPRVILPDGQVVPSRILAVDPGNDLAALAVDAANLPAARPGSSRGLEAGQWVMAMGHPWGITGSLTSGLVVGVGSGLPGMPSDRELVAVSLHLRPGYSGGPLVDAQGRVVGVNTMMAGPEVGLAVPVHIVEAFLGALAEQTAGRQPEQSPMVAQPVANPGQSRWRDLWR
jgi:serine protease Do